MDLYYRYQETHPGLRNKPGFVQAPPGAPNWHHQYHLLYILLQQVSMMHWIETLMTWPPVCPGAQFFRPANYTHYDNTMWYMCLISYVLCSSDWEASPRDSIQSWPNTMTFWTGAGLSFALSWVMSTRINYCIFNVAPAGSMTKAKALDSRWRSKTRRWRKFSKNRKSKCFWRTTIRESAFEGYLSHMSNYSVFQEYDILMVQQPKAARTLVKQTWWTTNSMFSCDRFGIANNVLLLSDV